MNILSSGTPAPAAAPATAAQQRAAIHAASSGFDWEKMQSYFNMFDSLVVAVAHLLGVVHETVNADGTVTPRNVALVAHDVNAVASQLTAGGVAVDTSARVAQIAATVASHGSQIAAVASDVQSIASEMTAHTSAVTKAVEAAAAIPGILDDVAQIKSMVSGSASAGGSHQE